MSMAGLHVLGKFFLGNIFLEISNDAVQRFCHAVNLTNLLANLNVWEKKICPENVHFCPIFRKICPKTKHAQIFEKFTQFSKVAQYMQSSHSQWFSCEKSHDTRSRLPRVFTL